MVKFEHFKLNIDLEPRHPSGVEKKPTPCPLLAQHPRSETKWARRGANRHADQSSQSGAALSSPIGRIEVVRSHVETGQKREKW